MVLTLTVPPTRAGYSENAEGTDGGRATAAWPATRESRRATTMSDQLIPEGDGYDEGGDINEDLSNQPINDPDD